MLRLTISEYGQIRRSQIPAAILRSLQQFDEHFAKQTGDTVFDWSQLSCIRAKSYVGVVQIGDLQIELLPKIDEPPDSPPTGYQNSRQNLLYMLGMASRLPFHDRDLASQRLRRLPLWEALIRAFATKLLTELRRGQCHAYQYREEDLACIRGRILVQQQLTQNATRRHKIRVGYEEFTNDILLNGILKAGCLRLLALTTIVETQQLLRECMLELADVASRTIGLDDFEQVRLDRNSERYRELLEFCRLVFLGSTPSAESGQNRTFSLLFPMEVLFEEFVGRCLKKFAHHLEFARTEVHLQSANNRRWLLRDLHGSGRFQLKPDILIRAGQEVPRVVLDTKWKRLSSDVTDAKNGVSQGDMYQLYAYANRYHCINNILLFPSVPDATPKTYMLEDSPSTRLRVEFLNLDYDLRQHPERLVANLKHIVGEI